jgi:hypothetical protein
MGGLTPVLDAAGDELVLDRPTSLEFLEDTAYVVSVTGDVYRVSASDRRVSCSVAPRAAE